MRRGEGWGIVFDCDGTLFPRDPGSLMQIVDNRALPETAKQASAQMRDFYLPFAMDGTLNNQQERDWLIETVRIYTEHRITETQLRAALCDMRLRPGVADGLRELRAAGVNMGVISYGVAPLIRIALDINGVANLFDGVYAADMEMDEHGCFVSYNPDSFVTPDDKGKWSRLFAASYRIPDSQLLAVGDSGGDRTLGILRENRLGVVEKWGDRDKLLRHMSKVVLVRDGFEPAIRWLKNRIGLR